MVKMASLSKLGLCFHFYFEFKIQNNSLSQNLFIFQKKLPKILEKAFWPKILLDFNNVYGVGLWRSLCL
jgi:hypothetical protein